MAFKSKSRKNRVVLSVVFLLLCFGLLAWKTRADLLPLPVSLTLNASQLRKVRVLDRDGMPLTVTYQNQWNLHDYVHLHDIPRFLQLAFLVAEDQRYYRHGGIDWTARWHALFQNIGAMRPVRGASTITEQVVRMWHPRPRTLWTRWLEGLEAGRLEERFSKEDILEFYLNQVPYAGRRRGVIQAARYYFDRDLDTLSLKEMLALAVMVRAPGRMDLHKGVQDVRNPTLLLAMRLLEKGVIDAAQYEQVSHGDLQIRRDRLPVQASHFVHYVYRSTTPADFQTMGRLHTTLDADLQHMIQTILDSRLKNLRRHDVGNGAVLVLDHHSREVLAWVNGGGLSPDVPGSWFDAVTTPRQPGSTLKPFLYALALERGWTAATLLDDFPLSRPVGVGLHAFQNYSRTFYGPLRLRVALGNSLNIPAVRAVQFVGVEDFLERLHELGIKSLKQHPRFYGEGLALGNGEITLLELVMAYGVLAQGGIYKPLKVLKNDELTQDPAKAVFSPEVSSLIGHILSDPDARKLEFGHGSLLRFPVQTAVKTGTSSDYRDAWAVGFNHRYVVGVWVGNLDHRAMAGITGATGPALVLRSVFAELNRRGDTRPLFLSPRLVSVEICADTGLGADDHCPSQLEWFLPGTEPAVVLPTTPNRKTYRLISPTPDLQLAMDPRIADDQEAFSFRLAEVPAGASVDWYVDDEFIAMTSKSELLWPLKRGTHLVRAELRLQQQPQPIEIPAVRFFVQ